jgi:hypothetical protein
VKLEYGLIRDENNKIVFEKPSIDRNCDQGCIILTLGCFFITLLRKGCI